MRQHLAAARAIATVCSGELVGAELGSATLTFHPRAPRSGRFRFSVGSAGSTTLVCQTVLPALLRAPGASELEIEGGTHNPLAPSYDFLKRVYFPIVRGMGVTVESKLLRYGFAPAGGGAFRVRLVVPARCAPFERCAVDGERRVEAWAYSARIAEHVANRQLSVVRAALHLPPEAVKAHVVEAAGPGNALCIVVAGDQVGEAAELVTAHGRRGVRAEEVAAGAVKEARRYLDAAVPVGEHLADQLVLLGVLAGGVFRTFELSSHATTNIEVVRAFLGADAVVVEASGPDVLVRVRAAP